jgi:hypothetical protein
LDNKYTGKPPDCASMAEFYVIKSFPEKDKRIRNFRPNIYKMEKNKTMLRIVLCIAIIVAFFLPWFKYGSGSGFDIIKQGSPGETTATMIIRYSFLLIPFFALIVLIRSINKRSSNFLLRLLPFLVTAILTALFIMGINMTGIGGELRSWLEIIDFGLYIMAIASLLLVFI